jgi:hypothetical protein
MKIGAFITITRPEERGDTYKQCLAAAREFADVVTVINGEETWPYEFSWEVIGQHFQAGYVTTEADWVIHLDTDFIFHEMDYGLIRQACIDNNNSPALSFWKYQFVLPDRYNLKSRLVLAVNKGKYGDRIRFDSGGDLCQPSLDGQDLSPDTVPEARIPFFNYEKILKTEAQIKEDVGRMARAYQRYFGTYTLGGPDDDSAFEEWLKMTKGRFNGRSQERVGLSFHPEVMRETIKNLKPEQFGYSGLGHLRENDYVA